MTTIGTESITIFGKNFLKNLEHIYVLLVVHEKWKYDPTVHTYSEKEITILSKVQGPLNWAHDDLEIM